MKVLIIFVYTILLSILGGFALLMKRGEEKYHSLAVHWASVILTISRVKVTLRGIENLERAGSYIYVANHASMFDVWILLVVLPGQVRFIFKKELTRIPIFGWILRHSGHVVIDRSSRRNFLNSLEAASKIIQNGKSVVVFPEGTRTVDGKLQAFKRGSFALAFKAMVPVVPVTINGSFKIFRKGSWKINRGNIEVVVGRPIEMSSFRKAGKEDELMLMGAARSAIEESYVNQ